MHLGPRVTALVDGRMSAGEEERAWAHVHTCATCRAAVEREGWVKRQLACLSFADPAPAPDALKGSLCSPGAFAAYPDLVPTGERGRRFAGLAAIGAGSVGAAMFAVLALSAPAEAPVMDRRAPATNLLVTPAPSQGPASSRDDEAAAVIRTVASTLMRIGL